MPTNEEVADALSNMSVLEILDLTRTMEEKWGVKAAPCPVYDVPSPAYGAPPGMVEEQTEFSVMLVGAGEKKIEVIKVVRALTGLGLGEAKALVDGLGAGPKALKESVSKAEAEDFKRQLETAGAKVELN